MYVTLVNINHGTFHSRKESAPYPYHTSEPGLASMGIKVYFTGTDFLERRQVREVFGWSKETTSEVPLDRKKALFTNLAGPKTIYTADEASPRKRFKGVAISSLTFVPATSVDMLNGLAPVLQKYVSDRDPSHPDPETIKISGLLQTIAEMEGVSHQYPHNS